MKLSKAKQIACYTLASKQHSNSLLFLEYENVVPAYIYFYIISKRINRTKQILVSSDEFDSFPKGKYPFPIYVQVLNCGKKVNML